MYTLTPVCVCVCVSSAQVVLSNTSDTPTGVPDARQLVRFEHPNGDRLTVASDASLAYARANGCER
jgi:hypothetical protein